MIKILFAKDKNDLSTLEPTLLNYFHKKSPIHFHFIYSYIIRRIQYIEYKL